jgi:hypothetical protein
LGKIKKKTGVYILEILPGGKEGHWMMSFGVKYERRKRKRR